MGALNFSGSVGRCQDDVLRGLHIIGDIVGAVFCGELDCSKDRTRAPGN